MASEKSPYREVGISAHFKVKFGTKALKDKKLFSFKRSHTKHQFVMRTGFEKMNSYGSRLVCSKCGELYSFASLVCKSKFSTRK